MMATEATPENIADASNTDEKQNVLTESRHDVPSTSTPPPVHAEASSTDGDNPEKGSAQPTSAAASVSGGSDTEGPKGESSKPRVDDKGNARAASIVKKPTSFKAVTVNKNFLAAKGATVSAASKLGENKPATASPTVQAGPPISTAPRPRLVAKTGSGLRDSAPRNSAAINGAKIGAAPDPSAVWNKNRPAPPPDVKRLTDEDLRKQYGIHLATRIQGDDRLPIRHSVSQKQANWADIDDDEEDWAPETIEWTDGTKITLHQADEPPVEQTQSKPPAAPEMSKPQSPAPPSSTSSTVKLGGILSGSGKGLVLKGAVEKPTLVAKPPGPPTAVKSPWAPLPPTKVAPIVTEPDVTQQQQQAPSKSHSKDYQSSESMPPPPLPAKEIAADDFSRRWRENPQNRELYNSQSGRYEPVTENLRNSRNDGHSRQPALLQRPTHHEQQGPAEPSGAFQTHRTSGESSYGRRRNSSNVSGGSGNNMRRVSFNRGVEMPASHEMAGPRRGSLAAVSDSPSSPPNFSPAAPHPGQRNNAGQPWQSRASPDTSHNSPNLVHGQPAPAVQSGKQLLPVKDDLELQKKIMSESIEAARKRKLEIAAKEEADRKERIRLKLESLGPPPESSKHKKDASTEEKATPKQIQARDPAEARTKTGALEVTGDVKHVAVANPEQKRSVEQKAHGSSAKDPGSNQAALKKERRNSSDHVQSTSQPHLTSQSWQSASQQNKFPGWNGNAHASTNRNVWGGHHGIGNGSFGLQETAGSQNGPGPIGPPNSYRSNGQQNRAREQFGSRPGPIAPPNGQSMESRRQPMQNQAPNPWANYSIAESDRQIAAAKAQQNAERLEREAIEGVKKPQHIDTWKQTGIDSNGERTGVKRVETTVLPATINGVPVDEMAPPTNMSTVQNGVRHDVLGGAMSNRNVASCMTTSPPQRGSRFFPTRDIRLEDMSFASGRSSSPPQPPPTMAGQHPAYDGDSVRPHVSLPRPAPVVRLPPPKLAPIGPPKPAPTFAAAVAGLNNQPIPSNSLRPTTQLRGQNPQPEQGPQPGQGGQSERIWQDKFDHLIGRKASPPKSYALAVNSSSKHAFELLEGQTPATVTLPGSRPGGSSADESSFNTKPMSEECFEEQEMGSRPVFNLPRASAFHSLAPIQKPKEQKLKAVDSLTVKPPQFSLFPLDYASGTACIHIKVLGMGEKKTIAAPCLNQKGNSRRGGQRAGSSRGNLYTRGGRRENSGNYSSKLDNASSTAPNSNLSRARGRGFGSNNWSASRHASTPVTSN